MSFACFVDVLSLKSHLKFPVIATPIPCSETDALRRNGRFLSDICGQSAAEAAAKYINNRESREICP